VGRDQLGIGYSGQAIELTGGYTASSIGARGGQYGGHDTTGSTQTAIEPQLTKKFPVAYYLTFQLTRGDQNAKCNRQIESTAGFGDVGRR
jgi:hypothetical protein